MLLNNVTLQGKSIDLADARDHEGANVVTILMGNNGSGKSRLFQTICSTFIQAPRQNMMEHYLRDVVNLSDLEHIEVAVPGVTYRYKSEKGRKTIEVCGLLRYHEKGGRKDIDPVLQAVLNYAGDKQTPEALQAAHDYLSSQLGIELNK